VREVPGAVLFALNERYFVNEKGSMRTAGSFGLCPEGFEEIVPRALAEPGRDPARLRESVGAFEAPVRMTREIGANR
jgi:hypothetical protein